MGDLKSYLGYTIVLVQQLADFDYSKRGYVWCAAVCEDHEDGVKYACELLGLDYEETTRPRGWWDTGQIISLEGELYMNKGWDVKVMIQDTQAITPEHFNY